MRPPLPLCIFLLAVLTCGSPLLGADGPIPGAFFPESTFRFPSVLDGETVRHDFIVLNRGKAPLDILDVKPDCGCTTVSYPPQIPPGGKGRISILLNTGGFGGEHVVKTIFVRTNSRIKPGHDLVMAGDVLPLADIDPPEVKLTGNSGQNIRQTVTITPVKGNPFRILEAKAEKGKDIRYELKVLKSAGTARYLLDVQNTRRAKGWYMDSIILNTTSRKSPTLKIRVLGILREPGRSGSEKH